MSAKGVRRLFADQLSLDAAVSIQLVFPMELSQEELDDVKEWFAIRVRKWEREIAKSSEADGKGIAP